MQNIKPKFRVLKGLLFLLLIVAGCQQQLTYKYLPGLEMYMKEVHNTAILDTEETLYYILPVSDCNTCQTTDLNLEVLNSISLKKPELIVVLSGITNKTTYKNAIEPLKLKYKVLEDPKAIINSYQTGVSKPLLIHLKEKEVRFYLNITDDKVNMAQQYLEEINL